MSVYINCIISITILLGLQQISHGFEFEINGMKPPRDDDLVSENSNEIKNNQTLIENGTIPSIVSNHVGRGDHGNKDKDDGDDGGYAENYGKEGSGPAFGGYAQGLGNYGGENYGSYQGGEEYGGEDKGGDKGGNHHGHGGGHGHNGGGHNGGHHGGHGDNDNK